MMTTIFKEEKPDNKAFLKLAIDFLVLSLHYWLTMVNSVSGSYNI